MPSTSLLKNPIARLTTMDPELEADIDVIPMSHELAARWDRQVQPLIDVNYSHATHESDPRATRADVGWKWGRLLDMVAWHNFGRHVGRHSPAVAMSIVVRSEARTPFPIGMLTTVPQYRCSVVGARKDRAFAWYLADAPMEAYELLDIPAVKNVALALLDCGVQASSDLGTDGSLLLRSAPQGGAKLHRFYARAGMERLADGAPPITPFFRRWHSEQYFHFDEVKSRAFCRTFDNFRKHLAQKC